MSAMDECAGRGALAREIFGEGSNCAEAVWAAFADEDRPEEALMGYRLAGGFGGGVNCGDLCGAVAGAVLVLGREYGRRPGEPRNQRLKDACRSLYERSQELLGSVHCRDLRDFDDPDYREKCELIVKEVADLLEEELAADSCA